MRFLYRPFEINDIGRWKCIFFSYATLFSCRKTEYHADNEALLLLLKGACLRQMQHPLQAEECLRRVLQLEKSVKEDTYLFPYATVELSLLAQDQGNIQLAIGFLEDAK